jgi:hypothetical protein
MLVLCEVLTAGQLALYPAFRASLGAGLTRSATRIVVAFLLAMAKEKCTANDISLATVVLCSSLLASQISRATERLRETLRSREGDMPHNHVLHSPLPQRAKNLLEHLRQFLFAISFLADIFFFVHFETPLEIETTFHLCLPRHQLILTRSTLARHFNILLTLSPRFETRLSRCD